MTDTLALPDRLNVADRFLEARVREGAGDRTALRLEGDSWTYRDVQRLSHRFALCLADLGVRPEERVLLALPDGPDMVGGFFGTLHHGAVVVLVNPALDRDALSVLFEYVRPRAAVVDVTCAAAFDEARSSRWPETLLVCGDPSSGSVPVGARHFDEVSRGLGDRVDGYPSHRDEPAVWLFSGGTTGRPKAVVQPHGSFATTAELYARRTLGWTADDVTLSVPKLFFGYATGSNLLFPFLVGGSTVLFPEPPTPDVLFAKIRRHRPTILVHVPTVVGRMVDHPDASAQDLSSLRFATSAGEPLPPALHRRWDQTFGVDLLDGLGTAEMWHVFLSNRPGEIRPGTLGRVVDGFEIRVRDDEDRDLPDGEVGRLWVRGGARALGYWQEHARSCDAFRGEWFVGGDLVRRDADGFVTYCGRSDDVVKVAGRWLVPREVEAVLLSHPEVEECAVVTVEDAAGLVKPWAFVLAPEGAPDLPEVLRDLALERLDAYKHPRRVVVLEEFPRTHLGKVDRGALARRAREETDGGR